MVSNDDDQPINIGGKQINQSSYFKYLGSLVNIESNSTKDEGARLAATRGVTLPLIYIWKLTEIGLKLKIQLIKSLVWSVALYVSESWAMEKTEEKK